MQVTQPEPAAQVPATAHSNAAVGQIIQFGGYYWRVLDVDGSRALLLSEHILFQRNYRDILLASVALTWENSDIRHYLNSDFFNRFVPQDRARIVTTTVINNDNPWFGTPGGNSTSDNIFLLSIEEVVRYFGDSGQLVNRPVDNWIHDEYDNARVARNLQGEARSWWLRSLGNYHLHAVSVHSDGRIIVSGGSKRSNHGVRPAMWIYLN